MEKITNRNLLIFFAATFIWTWACYAPIAISGSSPYQMPWTILLILGGAGPSVVGVVMAFLTYNQTERGDFWRRCFSPRRIGGFWWLLIFTLFPLIFLAAGMLDVALGGVVPGMEQLKALLVNPALWPLVIFISFMSGPWAEEFGWRGYALPALLKRFGVIPGTVSLGLAWGIWHLPLFFMPATWHGQMGFKLAGFWLFLLFSVGLSLLMSWVYLNTHASSLSGMLLHFTSNFTGQLLAPVSDEVEILRTLLILAIGLGGCMWICRKPFRRAALMPGK